MIQTITRYTAALALCSIPFLSQTSTASTDDSNEPVLVCNGRSVEICGEQPPLPPGGRAWVPTNPRGREDDGGQANPAEYGDDDDMGPAVQAANGSWCITVTNSGGDLFGPEGGDQNGFWEGSCIEVKICWPYYKPVTKRLITGYDSLDRPIYVTWTVIEEWEACSPWVEVCPCDE